MIGSAKDRPSRSPLIKNLNYARRKMKNEAKRILLEYIKEKQYIFY